MKPETSSIRQKYLKPVGTLGSPHFFLSFDLPIGRWTNQIDEMISRPSLIRCVRPRIPEFFFMCQDLKRQNKTRAFNKTTTILFSFFFFTFLWRHVLTGCARVYNSLVPGSQRCLPTSSKDYSFRPSYWLRIGYFGSRFKVWPWVKLTAKFSILTANFIKKKLY